MKGEVVYRTGWRGKESWVLTIQGALPDIEEAYRNFQTLGGYQIESSAIVFNSYYDRYEQQLQVSTSNRRLALYLIIVWHDW